MKILQVVPDLNLAGAQTMCENLVMELSKNKENTIEIISLYNNKTPITERLENNEIVIHYLSKRKGFDYSLIKKIRRIIKDFKPDIIHTHRYVLEYVMPSLIYQKKPRIIHTIHNMAVNEVPFFLQKLQYIWFKRKKVIPVAISEQVKESIMKRYSLINSMVPMVYNGIDLSKCIKKKGSNKIKNILHVGRFSLQKNHEELIDIFNDCLKEDNELRLILVGDGELQENIKNKVNKLNIKDKVIFKGEVGTPYKIMQSADVFVLTSKWEGMPMTLIEAMGTGLPCIAYPVGGIPDMIKNNINGFLPKNPNEFKNAILDLNKKSKNELDVIRKKNIIDSEKYSSKKMCEEYYKLYLNK